MEPSSPTDQPLNILVADDAVESRQLLVRLLQRFTRGRMFLSIVEVRDGAQALSAFRTHSPGLVFLDLDMPQMDGLSVLREIRTLDDRAFIVIVSGVSSAKNVNEALALGAGAFVVKPYSARRIVGVVQKYEKHCGQELLTHDEE
jgi:two-component system chemotaxis response regulator CheY